MRKISNLRKYVETEKKERRTSMKKAHISFSFASIRRNGEHAFVFVCFTTPEFRVPQSELFKNCQPFFDLGNLSGRFEKKFDKPAKPHA